jgi:hypothetical protein
MDTSLKTWAMAGKCAPRFIPPLRAGGRKSFSHAFAVTDQFLPSLAATAATRASCKRPEMSVLSSQARAIAAASTERAASSAE